MAAYKPHKWQNKQKQKAVNIQLLNEAYKMYDVDLFSASFFRYL